MLKVLLFLLGGFLLGVLIRKFPFTDKIVRIVSVLTMITVFLLIATLGFTIGSDEVLVSRLGTIGVKAMAIAVASVFGSVFLAVMLYRFMQKRK